MSPHFSHCFKKGIKAVASSFKVKQSEVSVLGRLRQEDYELETILVYIIRIYLRWGKGKGEMTKSLKNIFSK